MKHINIHMLSAHPSMTPHTQKIKQEISHITQLISKHLDIQDVDIVVLHNPDAISHGVAVGDITMDTYGFEISLHVTHKQFEKLLQKKLIYTLTHGLYYITRYRKKAYPKLLIDAFIAEGIATHLEIALYNEIPTYCSASQKKYDLMMQRAKQAMFSSDYDYEEWFFGSQKENIPNHTGHVIGFRMIKNYLLHHPEKTIKDLLDINILTLRKEIIKQEQITQK